MSENSGKYPSKFPKTQGDVFFYDFIISNFLLLFCSTNREQQKRSWNQWMFDIFLTKWLKQLIDYQHCYWFNFCQSTKQFCSRYNRLIGPFSCLPSTPTPPPIDNETSQKDSKSDLTMQKCQHIIIKVDNGAPLSVCNTAPTPPPSFSHLVPFSLDFYSGSVSLSPFKLCHSGLCGDVPVLTFWA